MYLAMRHLGTRDWRLGLGNKQSQGFPKINLNLTNHKNLLNMKKCQSQLSYVRRIKTKHQSRKHQKSENLNHQQYQKQKL